MIKTLAGLLKADSGTVKVFDEDPWCFGVTQKQRVGYLDL